MNSKSNSNNPQRKPAIVGPGQGRKYALGQATAVFIADGDEIDSRFSISEWTYMPGTGGPGAHAHRGLDHAFYIIEGTLSVFVDGEWLDAPQGSYVVIPGGTHHDFKNRGDVLTRFLNFDVPGGFESALRKFAALVEDVTGQSI